MAELKYELEDLNSNDAKTEVDNRQPRKWLTPKQKTYAIIIVAVLVFIIFLFIIGLIVLGVQVNQLKREVEEIEATAPCTTVDCINTVSGLMSSVDPSVDPCVDFHKYACGKWEKHNPIPESMEAWAPLYKLRVHNEKTVQRLIKRTTSTRLRYSKNEALRKVFTYYDACMDEVSMNKAGSKPLLDGIQVLGSCPGLNSTWNENTSDFVDVLSYVHRNFPTPMFFQIWVDVLDTNTSVNAIMMGPDGLGLRRTRYNSSKTKDVKIKKAYNQYMTSLLQLLGLSPNKSVEMMESVYSVEFDLAIMMAQRRSNSGSKVTKLKDMDKDANQTQLNWEVLFKNIFRGTKYKPNDDTPLKLYDPKYFSKLNKYLSTKPKGDLANYVAWQFIRRYSNLLSKPFLVPWNEYIKVFSEGGQSDPITPRWEKCVTEVKSYFGMAIGRMFVDEVFRNGSKQEATELVQDIKNVFIQDFDEVEWMDKETRELAKEKAKVMHGNIGYPELIMDDEKLAALYKTVYVKNDTHFENVLSVQAMESINTLNQMDAVPDRKSWAIYPTTINAVYVPTANSMDIPAGILQKPLFHHTYPGSVNFGGIGAIIGHEMTHGFDTTGKTYNQHGHGQKWWSNASIENFDKKTKCFVEQYGNFTYEGHQLDGNMVLGEVIADNGGTEIAFKAYKLWVKDHGKERQLPGAKLSHEQIFFVAYAQIFCSAYTKRAVTFMARRQHPINPLRIKGVATNSKEFAKAFKCPVGSPMNPAKKCKVW